MSGKRAGAGPGFDWRIGTVRSQADLAYDRLRQAIISGQFEPGQRVTEVGMATLLGVSRTPVRESFLRLEADGLLRSGASGVEVVDPREEAADIFLLRETVEGLAARLAATRASEREIEAITAFGDEAQRMGLERLTDRVALNERFHLAVAAASHAPRVERLAREYRSLFVTAERLGQLPAAKSIRLIRDHAEIAAAIAARDPDQAETRMRAHLRAAVPG